MKTPLASIRDCFEGVIPSIIATLDADGLPNVSYLSQVYLVDDEHVALSNQFFSADPSQPNQLKNLFVIRRGAAG